MNRTHRAWRLLLLGLMCITPSANASQGVCDTIRVEGSNYQKKKEGLYARLNDTTKCGERQVYRMVSPEATNFIFYLKSLNHWIVGSKMCENNGGLYVKNAALSPDKITSIWKEYKGRKWRTQHSIRVTCNDCKGPYFGKYCSNPCGKCQAGSCHTFWGYCMQGCEPGYTGNSCSTSCPLGTYGTDCWGRCRCAGGEPCDPAAGFCKSGCEKGWSSDDCSVHDCHQLYRKYLDKDQNMTSLCDHVFTMGAISLADCQVRACDYDANVISYSADDVTGQDGLCVVRKCQNGDLRLSSLHGGWNIHISKDMLGSDGKFPVNSKNGPGGIASLPPANVALALVSRGEPVAQSGGTVSVGMVILLTLIFSILVVSLAGAVFFSYNRFKERFGGFGYYRQDKQDDQMPVDIDQDNQYNNDAQPF